MEISLLKHGPRSLFIFAEAWLCCVRGSQTYWDCCCGLLGEANHGPHLSHFFLKGYKYLYCRVWWALKIGVGSIKWGPWHKFKKQGVTGCGHVLFKISGLLSWLGCIHVDWA